MRILWYSLSPCGSIRRSGEQRVIQGWMISLEDEIKKVKDIDLHVAYFSDTESENESCVGDAAGRGDESWRELCSTLVG